MRSKANTMLVGSTDIRGTIAMRFRRSLLRLQPQPQCRVMTIRSMANVGPLRAVRRVDSPGWCGARLFIAEIVNARNEPGAIQLPQARLHSRHSKEKAFRWRIPYFFDFFFFFAFLKPTLPALGS